jgi:hypothetical protein
MFIKTINSIFYLFIKLNIPNAILLIDIGIQSI